MSMKFPKEFIWGAATASYQIEGAAKEDGKGASVWDTFAHTQGKVANGETGDVACDHYHKYKEDVAMMKEMGLTSYRFSLCWPRIIPDGDGEINPRGFVFYDALVDELLANGITPYVTLFHWDLPEALQQKGGFFWDGISDAFARYAKIVAEHFGNRVMSYATLNEPQIVLNLGYCAGVHAPGEVHPKEELGPVMRNLLLCHGKAVAEIRKANGAAKVSVASTGTLCYPSTDDAADVAAAREATFDKSGENLFSHHWFLDPVCLGENHTPLLKLSEEDMKVIHQPIDYIGINVYNGSEFNKDGYVERYTGFPRTSIGWPVTEKVMEYGFRFLYERYQLPLIITENGQACNDRVFLDGAVHDPDRIDFMERYLTSLSKAIEWGADIRGYYHWSLMDNFEWAQGYGPRFGLIFVDYNDPARKRIMKDSAYYYRDLIRKMRG